MAALKGSALYTACTSANRNLSKHIRIVCTILKYGFASLVFFGKPKFGIVLLTTQRVCRRQDDYTEERVQPRRLLNSWRRVGPRSVASPHTSRCSNQATERMKIPSTLNQAQPTGIGRPWQRLRGWKSSCTEALLRYFVAACQSKREISPGKYSYKELENIMCEENNWGSQPIKGIILPSLKRRTFTTFASAHLCPIYANLPQEVSADALAMFSTLNSHLRYLTLSGTDT